MSRKLKLLYLRDYLLRESDEDHPVTIADMVAHLASWGITAERKSLYDDIEALREYGMEIECVKTKTTGYYVLDRDFQLPEVKLLVDAVQSSRFITPYKTQELIEKIEGLASSHEARTLHRQVFMQNRIKSMNESVYYNVDIISEAIEKGRRLRFQYFDLDHTKKRVYRKQGADYLVHPAFLVWEDEKYYLVAKADDTEDIRHYRIDKMSGLRVAAEKADRLQIDPAEYTNTLFGMYAGQKENVRIRFKNDLAGVVLDRFGSDIIFVPDGEDHFAVNVDVCVSPQFFAWVFGLGSGVEITGPESVRQAMADKIRQQLTIYEK